MVVGVLVVVVVVELLTVEVVVVEVVVGVRVEVGVLLALEGVVVVGRVGVGEGLVTGVEGMGVIAVWRWSVMHGWREDVVWRGLFFWLVELFFVDVR